MLSKFQIDDHQNNTQSVVEAQGLLEAIGEHLSSPILNLSIDWSPNHGRAEVIDRQTKNTYSIVHLNTSGETPMTSTAYKSGLKAAQMGIDLEDSALNNLHPDSARYDEFIAGYDSFSSSSNDVDDHNESE